MKTVERRAEKYRKRLQRLKKDHPSPRSKVNKLLRQISGTALRKTLLFHTAVAEEVRTKYAHSRRESDRQVIARIVTGKILRKYRLQRLAEEVFGFSRRRWRKLGNENVCGYQRKKHKGIAVKLRSTVRLFFSRDDVSRITTGKKQTVTKEKIKMQKRLLVDSMKNLHLKFLAEQSNLCLSYSLFCTLRPYWVVHPTLSDRETCMCKQHENLGFIAKKLHQMHIIDTSNLETLTQAITCDTTNKQCMYGECEECINNTYALTSHYRATDLVFYLQWATVDKEHRNDPGTAAKITVKKEFECSQEELVNMFAVSLQNFRRHLYNIRQQYAFSRALKLNLPANECVVHVDFSENYSCKYSSEVQAVHFGASHQQATLHTGVYYVGQAPTPTSFCTVSASRLKGPPAIWQHLEPILREIRERCPDVTTVHFFCDGPCTQYKQRGNFYLFCTEIYKKGFTRGSWNYFEASHGKGAPDGVGATLKRRADRLVSQGVDIPTALSLYQALSEGQSKVKLFYIEEQTVEEAVKEMPADLPAIPSTMRLHQVVTLSPGKIFYRDVSCMCSATGNLECDCQKTKYFSFNPTEDPIRPAPDEVQWHNPEVVGKWCALVYDHTIYPGIIQEVNETHCQVKCMHRVGENRFFWPLRDDLHWYPFEDVLTLIPTPENVTSRHMAIARAVWDTLAIREM